MDVYSIALFFIALFLTFITSYFLLGRNFLSNILGSFTFSTLLSVIYSFFRGSLIYKRVSTTTPKLFSPEQFEERFKETIKDIRNKKNKNKIVIAIDEIDRCPKEQVLEILQTVKTFLEIENTVFIIAIDDQRLREFLDVPQDYANELLRKIFNTSIKLKAFSEQDLYHFGEKLAKEYGLEIPKTVISLVCQEFSKYPRKIIQFFNIFQNELYLACLQEEKNYIPKGTIRDNIEFFTKLLIIREHYPDIYKRLIDNRNLIQDIHQHIRDGKFRKNEDGRWKSGELKLTIDEDAYRFFRRTSHIEVPPDKIELFIFIKDVFKDIPDEFYQLIISQDWEQIKEKMEKNKIEFSRLLRFIDDIVDMDVVRRGLYGTTGFNVLSLLFKIIYKPRENKEGENKERENLIRQIPEYKNIMSLFSSLELWKWEYLIKYPPKEMMYSVKFFTETFKERVNLKEIIGSEIESQGSIKSKEAILVIIYYTKAFEDFSYIIMDKFKSIYNSPEIKHLLEDGFVENRIIPSLTQNYKENQTEEKVKVMEELHARRLLNDEIINAFVDKCLSMLGTLENHKNWEIFEFWLEKLNKFIGRYLNEDTKTKLFEAIQNNHSFIIQCYKDGAFEKVYKNWIDLITSFYLVSSNSEQKQNLIKWLNEFYIYTKYLILRYEYIIENTYDYTFMPDILNIADKEDDLGSRIQLSNLLKLMVIRSKEDKGLNDEQIRQIVDFFFKNLFE
ncbi:MAG: P-loop NTPase fold protein, partial [Candidatus Sericytochromatia bacterium]